MSLNNLANIQKSLGRLSDALGGYCEGLSISRRLGLAPLEKLIRENLGLLRRKRAGLSCEG